jgi:hypothetical protein
MKPDAARAAEMRKILEESSRSGQTFDYWRRELRGKPRLVKVILLGPLGLDLRRSDHRHGNPGPAAASIRRRSTSVAKVIV